VWHVLEGELDNLLEWVISARLESQRWAEVRPLLVRLEAAVVAGDSTAMHALAISLRHWVDGRRLSRTANTDMDDREAMEADAGIRDIANRIRSKIGNSASRRDTSEPEPPTR
jgi:hypothetical protein